MPKPDLVDLQALVAPWAAHLITRCFSLGAGALAGAPALLRPILPSGRWLVVADPITWDLAGSRLEAELAGAGLSAGCHLVQPGPGQPSPVADEAQVAMLSERLRLAGAATSAVVAVGAGTVNDIAKAAAHATGRPYAVVATAPSMNGYTSGIAALMARGIKITRPCQPPLAFVADVDLLAKAPYRMIVAGLGDLSSKPVSQADWLLSRRLLGTPYAPRAAELIEAGTRLLEGVPARLPGRDPGAVARLTAGLCLSGLAMAVAGSSSPASGGEHLISHFLDMTAGPGHADLHGCQVGVATLVTAAMYARLSDLGPEAIDPEACAAAHPTWPQRAAAMEACFGPLAAALFPEARDAHPSTEDLQLRLGRLRTEWDELQSELRPCLEPAAQIEVRLRQAQAPSTFAQLGVALARARLSVLHGKDIRNRYTILHLAAELGRLETWTDQVLALLGG